MAFAQVTNSRLSDKVVDVIMNMISEGTLKAGDKLPNENELAEKLNVSRGILREALIILQARGYIVRKPKEGTIINDDVLSMLNKQNGISLQKATFLDMIEMRECIEQRVVEKIIDEAKQEELEEILRIVMNLSEKTYKEDQENSPDYYFHYHLAELSKNAMFMNFMDTYYNVANEMKNDKSRKKQDYIEMVSARKLEINKEHLNIAHALLSRNKEEAKNAVSLHLRKVKELAINEML